VIGADDAEAVGVEIVLWVIVMGPERSSEGEDERAVDAGRIQHPQLAVEAVGLELFLACSRSVVRRAGKVGQAELGHRLPDPDRDKGSGADLAYEAGSTVLPFLRAEDHWVDVLAQDGACLAACLVHLVDVGLPMMTMSMSLGAAPGSPWYRLAHDPKR
jgi:hypothetical protein